MEAPVVAVVGGGQLARMSAAPATALGLHLRVLVESLDAATAQAVPDSRVGTPDDVHAVLDLVEGADVLTFEHEHVPPAVLDAVVAAGVPVRPGPGALLHAQDKLVMRRALTELGLPCPAWAPVADADDLAEAIVRFGGRAVLKTARGGYDGKGVRVVTHPDQAADWLAAAADGTGPALLAEQQVPFARELAALVARRPSGEVATWPVVQSVQREGVCEVVIAPAPDLHPLAAASAQRVARQVAEALDVTGVLAVELFEVPGEAGEPPAVLVNELAMRPHNSGHWTIDGSLTSQFEQHLRAVSDLPLGGTAPRAPWTVMVNVLGSTLDRLTDALPRVLADGAVKVHLYGKRIRPGRKLGHVTVCGDDLDDVMARASAAAATLRGPDIGRHCRPARAESPVGSSAEIPAGATDDLGKDRT